MSVANFPKTARLGILGGMFDPIHLGHLLAAHQAEAIASLEQMILLPCGNPVHRSKSHANNQQRYDMLQLAILDKRHWQVDSRECLSHRPSRTVDTLRVYRDYYSQAALFFIMGMDAFFSFDHWYNWQDILELCSILVVPRSGLKITDANKSIQEIYANRHTDLSTLPKLTSPGKIAVLQQEVASLSSTQLRYALNNGEPLDTLVPAAVAAYIQEHGIYL